MAEMSIPAGASFETLNNLLIGWYRAGAFETARSNEEVADRVGAPKDTVSRNNGFFEDIKALVKDGQKHKLSELGRDYAKYLDYGQLDDAKRVLAKLLRTWEPLTKLLDVIDIKGPLGQDD